MLRSKTKNDIENEYRDNPNFNPSLFAIIEKKIHIVPLWSGLMLKYIDIDETRLSNNVIESWFGNFKNKLLALNKRVRNCRLLFLNEIAAPLYFLLNEKFYIFSIIFFLNNIQFLLIIYFLI